MKQCHYDVIFMRGDIYRVKASSVKNALTLCHKLYPDTYSYDVLEIRKVV